MAVMRAAKRVGLRNFVSNARYLRTLVIGEQEGGVVKAASISAVQAAKSLSDGGSISFLLAGSGPNLLKAASHASSSISVSQVLVADSDRFTHALAEPCSSLIKLVHLTNEFSHIIAPSNSFGKNILPRVAALLDVSPITDVVDIINATQFVRPIYAGNALSTVKYNGKSPCMLTVRSTSFPVSVVAVPANSLTEAAPITKVDFSTLDEESVGRSRYVKHTFQDSERPDLGNARIVVTGGRGLKSAENFKMVEKLAAKLGAAVGATRAAVDAGFVPNDLQVGQTGKIVAPDLYMAFGVSGAIQHIAGMRDSKVIVAVNKDPDAPIFQVADYGLVGDLFEVIPQLIEQLPSKN